jgi:hypothetical protein
MNTRNEAVQKYLTEGLKAARNAGMPPAVEDGYCAAYLAQKLAHLERDNAMAYTPSERKRLSSWMHQNADAVLDVIGDITTIKLAELAEKGEFALGDYLTSKFTAAMLHELESTDAEPCHLAEDDMRERVKGYQVEELGFC